MRQRCYCCLKEDGRTYKCHLHSLLNARHCATLWGDAEEQKQGLACSPKSFRFPILCSQNPSSQTSKLIITFWLAWEQGSCNYSREFSQPGVGDESAENGRQVAESHEGVVDGGGQVVVPLKEPCEVQDQECFPQQTGQGRESTVRSGRGNWRSARKGVGVENSYLSCHSRKTSRRTH